jgi:pyrroline-5-carboxylate reductase
MKLTIVGNGIMALAIADGLKDKYELEFIARDTQKVSELSKKYNAQYLHIDGANIENKNIILCIKPHALDAVSSQLSGKANSLYSVLAGIPLATLKKKIYANHTVRAMPNIAAAFGASATALTGDKAIKEEAKKIFNMVGESIWLNSERELDIATAIIGSGPAYLALVAEAMMDGGVKEGLKRNDSVALVRALFSSFSPILFHKHPALIKDSVMSPGGTTAAGYGALEEGNVRDAFIKSIEAAFMVTQRQHQDPKGP